MIKHLIHNEKYGIPQGWLIFFTLLLFSSLSLFVLPDSWSKGILIQAVGIFIVTGTLASFFYKKHSLFPWIFLLVGVSFIGITLSLLFLVKVDIPINATFMAVLMELGVIFIFIFSYSVILTYEKKLNLSGLTFDLALLTLSIVIFYLFAHPTLLNTLIYDLNIVQKTHYANVLASALVLFMSVLVNILYKGKRIQLLVLIPASAVMLIQFFIKNGEPLNLLENIQYSPLSSELFILAGVFMCIFTFIESFSDQAIAEEHLEIQNNFTQFSNRLMWTATIFAVIAIPTAIIIRILFSYQEVSLLVTAMTTLVLSAIVGMRLVFIIKKSQTQQQKLLSITQTDKLTGLLNYAGFYDSLLNKDFKKLLIIIINIDGFKSVNDYHGRKFGDQVLMKLAQKLDEIPDSIACSHLDTDNFIIAFELQEKDVKKRINHLIQELGSWNTILKEKIAVSLSFGACFKSDAKKLETKIGYAELALSKAKAKHIHYYLYQSSDSKKEIPKHELQKILQQAIDDEYLPVHFQPIYNLNDGSLKALEVLIRIESKKHGVLLPGQFLEQAQSYGLLVSLTKVCISMVAKHYDELPNAIININLPPFILKNTEILTNLIKHVKNLGLDPKKICFEITEDENIRADTLISQAKYLTDNNFTIAMDDFGTGYSSLERLSFISFDTVKVDRSLLLAASNGNKAILEGSIGLIKRLGESVVVEGVETIEQLILIKKLGADSVQGFLLSKPIPISKLINLPKNISQVVGDH